ncbi:hypothetical protein D1007_26086 [Hordeum vulgare]|nr:hypothetical protein D1007_26086 [Hordeum vulgare]
MCAPRRPHTLLGSMLLSLVGDTLFSRLGIPGSGLLDASLTSPGSGLGDSLRGAGRVAYWPLAIDRLSVPFAYLANVASDSDIVFRGEKGVRDNSFSIEDMDCGEFFLSMYITDRRVNLSWEVIIVYGLAGHSRSAEFLSELKNKFCICLFNDCIAYLALCEIASVGARFTSTNKQDGPIRSMLDRVFVSPQWERLFPLCSLKAVTRIGSDHTSLMLSSVNDAPPLTCRFHFESFWLSQSGFIEMFMRGWGANLDAEPRARKGALLHQIKALDAIADGPGLSPGERSTRYSLEASHIEIFKGEELFWKRRGDQNWLLKGDANTIYFHAIVNGRGRKCAIPYLWDDDSLLEHPDEISSHIYSFYKALFTAEPRGGVSLSEDLCPPEARVSHFENAELTLPFTLEEVCLAISSVKANSAPSPNGFPVSFFQKFWEVCATRLSHVVSRLAHPLKSAFLKGQRIHDEILALHEIVHEVASHGHKDVFLKLDFQKAYDYLNWSFLRLVMQHRGFDERWCSWIMQMVMSGNTAININGDIEPYFRSSRGMKQGYPISSLLFNLAVDALAGILDKARQAGNLKGAVSHLIPGGGVTHLQYADDTMIMVEGSALDIVNRKFLLMCFEAMSGLKIKFDKSELVVVGYSPIEQ